MHRLLQSFKEVELKDHDLNFILFHIGGIFIPAGIIVTYPGTPIPLGYWINPILGAPVTPYLVIGYAFPGPGCNSYFLGG